MVGARILVTGRYAHRVTQWQCAPCNNRPSQTETARHGHTRWRCDPSFGHTLAFEVAEQHIPLCTTVQKDKLRCPNFQSRLTSLKCCCPTRACSVALFIFIVIICCQHASLGRKACCSTLHYDVLTCFGRAYSGFRRTTSRRLFTSTYSPFVEAD